MLSSETPGAKVGERPNLAGILLAAALCASTLSACSKGSEGKPGGEAKLRCSAVREELRKERELFAKRVEELRRDPDARAAGPAQTRRFQALMADLEKIERRYAVRSKECVEE